MSETAYVKTEVSESIGTITFFHPSHNSLPGNILRELAEAIQAAGKNEEIRVIVLRSGGERTFCAGASFNELIGIEDFETGKAFFMGFARVINACRTCPKIILGRVQGKAVGGGVGVAAAVDYCFATKFAEVKLSELAVGIGPFVVGPAVQRKVGTSAFSQMAINATTFYSAEWARSKGLYMDIFDSAAEMDAAIFDLARTLVDSNPEAQSLIKKVSWEGTDHWDELLEQRAEMSGRLVLSDYTKTVLAKYRQG
ncbi:MAG: enoyl-CoA hydratase/isomerase family protein [Bacteroidia bacterium]|nr:enoyl-CoA hydratase/isomerase family protein [Bacteroidia bacterium]